MYEADIHSGQQYVVILHYWVESDSVGSTSDLKELHADYNMIHACIIMSNN